MSLLSWILLLLFIIACGLILTLRNFRTKYHIGIAALLLAGLLFSNTSEGSFDYEWGGFRIGLKKAGKDTTDFRLKNTSDKNISKTVTAKSNSRIEKVSINKGEGYLTIMDGGVGNNFIVYNVNIPPNQVVSGSVVSADAVIMWPDNPPLSNRWRESPTNKE